MALKMKGLSRVTAPTAPNCRKGPVACGGWEHSSHKQQQQQQQTKKVSSPHPHTLSIPHCTRSERGTVGHSCCHCRLNAATAAPMKITPRTKKNCMEGKHRLYSALTLVKKNKQTKTNQMVKAGATLCTQCRLGGSRRATWIRPKSCKK